MNSSEDKKLPLGHIPMIKHCQRHNGPRNWLRNLDWTWQQYGTTNISCKFGHQIAPLVLVVYLVTNWHNWDWFRIWSSGHVTCITWFQIWQPGCVTCIASLPWNVLLALSVSIGLVYSSARVTSVKSAQGVSVSEFERSEPIDRTPGTPGSHKNKYF